MNFLGKKMIESLVTPEKVNGAFDAYLAAFEVEKWQRKTIQISREKDGNYWVSVCAVELVDGEWRIHRVIKSEKLFDIVTKILCQKKD